MGKVFRYVKPYKKFAIIALLLMLVELSVELWQPLIMQRIIDDGISEGNLAVVWTWGGIMIGISLLALIAGIINSFYSSEVSQGYGYDVRNDLYAKIQSFSFANLSKFPTSSLITRLTNDVVQVQNVIFMGLRIALRAPLLIIGGMMMAFFVNVQLALVLLAATPFLLVFMLFIMTKGMRLFKAVQERLDRVNAVMRENLSGVRLIKAFFRGRHEVKRFRSANDELRDQTVRALRIVELAMPTLLLIMNVTIVAVLWFGNVQSIAGQAQVGEVVAVVNYGTRTMIAFSMLSFIIMGIARAQASANRISEVLDADVDQLDSERTDETNIVHHGKVTFDRVSFRYPESDTTVLKNISFDVQPQETVAILGATGSGKTSLFQLIPRLYDATGGQIALDDIPIEEYPVDYVRRQIGYVPQEALLFTGTIKENIAFGKEDATMEDIIQAAKHAQIHDTIEGLPNKYETRIGQKGVNLSGGQKQRISIARALVRRPRILLLDDCTSALDLKTEARLLQALQQYTCTTFVITQKISTVIRADSILLLDDGELLVHGSHQELLESSEMYQQIVESQFGKERYHELKSIQ